MEYVHNNGENATKFNLKATTCTLLLILAIAAVTALSVSIKPCHRFTLYQILTGASWVKTD